MIIINLFLFSETPYLLNSLEKKITQIIFLPTFSGSNSTIILSINQCTFYHLSTIKNNSHSHLQLMVFFHFHHERELNSFNMG